MNALYMIHCQLELDVCPLKLWKTQSYSGCANHAVKSSSINNQLIMQKKIKQKDTSDRRYLCYKQNEIVTSSKRLSTLIKAEF